MQITLSKTDILVLENILTQAKRATEKVKPVRKKTDAQIKRDFMNSIK